MAEKMKAETEDDGRPVYLDIHHDYCTVQRLSCSAGRRDRDRELRPEEGAGIEIGISSTERVGSPLGCWT